jgi:hypothetical protein
MAKQNYNIGDLDPAGEITLNNPKAVLLIFDPDLEDTFRMELKDLSSATGIGRVNRTLNYSKFQLEYRSKLMQFGRTSFVLRGENKNPVMVLEVAEDTIHPIAIEFFPSKAGVAAKSEMVTYNVLTNTTEPLSVTGSEGEFDGDRAVKTLPQIGVNYGGTTTAQWINNAFFGFQGAQIALALTATSFEYGTEFQVKVTGIITPREEETINNRQIRKLTAGDQADVLLAAFATNSQEVTDLIRKTTTYTVSADVDNNDDPRTISTSQTVTPVLPFFYGVGTPAQINNEAWVRANAQKSLSGDNETHITITSVAQRPFIISPVSFGGVSAVIDPDNSDIRGGFSMLAAQDYSFGPANEKIAYQALMLDADYTGTDVTLTVRF